MSSNIYEDPNMTTSVRYSKGARKDRGDRVERVVDIYESTDAFIGHRVAASAQDGGARIQNHLPAVRRNPFKTATLFLGLLCFLLLLGITFLSLLYFEHVWKSDHQSVRDAEELKANSECQSENKSQTEDNGWRRFQCHCYYTSTEKKTWAESRKDCKDRGADLVVINNKAEQTYIHGLMKQGDSWIGLEVVTGWTSEWKWVDGSPLSAITVWKKGVKLTPENVTKAYIDLQGKWNHASSGAKHWICERQIY